MLCTVLNTMSVTLDCQSLSIFVSTLTPFSSFEDPEKGALLETFPAIVAEYKGGVAREHIVAAAMNY
jgi:hypothetical protein